MVLGQEEKAGSLTACKTEDIKIQKMSCLFGGFVLIHHFVVLYFM